MDAVGKSRSLEAPSAPPPRSDRTIRKQAILIFCLLMFCYSYVHQRPGWNQNSRLDLLHAIYAHKTLKIDAHHGNTGDKSIHNGHYYSDKAPGIAFLALPAFALSAGVLRILEIDIDSEKGWLISDWITTALSVGLITALGGAAMFVFLCKLVPWQYACLTVIAVFLGSSPFPYATMLFSHAAVIGLLCIALWAIADDGFFRRHFGDPSVAQQLAGFPVGRYALTGLCCGFAIASEFPAAIAAGGVLALAALTDLKRGIFLALAAIPPLCLVPIYNWACFGNPLSFGYHNLALTEFQQMDKGLFGITFPPKPSSAYLILLSPERGLFFWTPFFLIGFFGVNRLKRASPNVFWVSCCVLLAQVLAISGYYMPSGGAAVGPRHLTPMLPFLVLFAAYGLRSHPGIGMVLGYISIGLTTMVTASNAMPPEHLAHPLTTYYLPRLFRGSFQETISTKLGLPPDFSFWILMIFSMAPFLLLWFASRSLNTQSSTTNATPVTN